jgi:hypothetical protein
LTPNQDQVMGTVRIVIGALCGWLVSKGLTVFGDASIVELVSGIVGGIVMLAWSIWAHTDANKIKSVADVDPNVIVHVPEHVMAKDPKIEAVVNDNRDYPNVVPRVLPMGGLGP